MNRIRLVSALALVVSLAVVAAGCGGDGNGEAKGYALTKAAYAAALSKICTDSNARLAGLELGSLDSFKENGDEATAIVDDTVAQFKALTPPDELKDASERFNSTADDLGQSIRDAAQAGEDGDQSALDAAVEKAQEAGKANDEAATEIGATGCVSG